MNVLIIGGGFAGLAAGVRAAAQGHRVTVLERRPFLGGRAYSFRDAKTGDLVDNGQHLFTAAFHATRRFLETIGTGDRLTIQRNLRLDFIEAGRATALRCLPLPAPFHVAAGLVGFTSLRWAEKRALLRAGQRLLAGAQPEPSQTVETWLDASGQTESSRRRFWRPLAVSALNEPTATASAAVFARAVSYAVFSHRADSCLATASVGLSLLYADPSRAFIERHGGRVLLNTVVSHLEMQDSRVEAVALKDGGQLRADAYIVAVPHHALLPLLPDAVREQAFFARIARLRASPIVTIYLWLDRSVLHRPFVGLIGRTVQWVFDRHRTVEGTQPGALACVISGAYEVVDWPQDALIDRAVADLKADLPQVKRARLIHALVVKERQATFSPRPEAEADRPPHATPIRNLLLAGDWTATGLPPTVESAVVSGHRAVDLMSGLAARSQ